MNFRYHTRTLCTKAALVQEKLYPTRIVGKPPWDLFEDADASKIAILLCYTESLDGGRAHPNGSTEENDSTQDSAEISVFE